MATGGGNTSLPLPTPQFPVYTASTAVGRLWQGEILENIPQWKLTNVGIARTSDLPGPDEEIMDPLSVEVTPIDHHLTVVMSQDCDLEQDFNARLKGSESLLNVLLCDAFLEAEAHAKFKNLPDRWQKLKQNQLERYQFLQAVAATEDLSAQGLSALIMDFKDSFTVPTAELYERLNLGSRRRCRLASPYLEHLSHRFYNFHSRVALPRDHVTTPAS